jgi:cytochrome c-type biogenesis protein CcmH
MIGVAMCGRLRSWWRYAATIAALALAMSAASVARADLALDTRLKALENELRCLVCQNQTLAESNAPLAEDLRKEVRELAVAGKSDDDIRAYLVARYGDFVLYKPPVKSTTYLLWFGPFALLATGLIVWLVVLRRRSAIGTREDVASSEAIAPPVAGAAARARALLEE